MLARLRPRARATWCSRRPVTRWLQGRIGRVDAASAQQPALSRSPAPLHPGIWADRRGRGLVASAGDPVGAMRGSPQLLSIQILRAVAALAVLTHHTLFEISFYISGRGVAQDILVGAAGVDLFFVISGFVMVYSSESTVWPQRRAAGVSAAPAGAHRAALLGGVGHHSGLCADRLSRPDRHLFGRQRDRFVCIRALPRPGAGQPDAANSRARLDAQLRNVLLCGFHGGDRAAAARRCAGGDGGVSGVRCDRPRADRCRSRWRSGRSRSSSNSASA